MKSATFVCFLAAVAFLCAGLPESQAGPPQVPGYRGPSHAQNPPGSRHHYTPTPHSKPSHSGHHSSRPPQPVHYGSHGPHGPRVPGFYPPPPPPIPVYVYPRVVVPLPVQTYTETYTTETYYDDAPSSGSSSNATQLGIFKAFVYSDPDDPEKVQQNGVAVFYINSQNLIGGYFYVKADAQPLSIQGVADPQTNEVEFRVVGTSGTYLTKLNQLTARDKVFLTLERETKEGEMESSEVGYLSRVEDKLK